MLKVCCCLFTSVLLCVTTYSAVVDARPQLIDEVFSKFTEAINDTAVSLLKELSPNASKIKNGNTKNRTRILFRGDLLTDFSDQDIIFPDSYQTIFEEVPKIRNAPKCAKSKTFCENFDSYPYEQVQHVLHRNPVKNDLFGKDEFLEDRYTITNRNGDFEAFICSSIQKTVFPRVGKNKNNKWKYIINQKESDGYIQGIRVEICRKEGSACDLIGERVNGYITSCKQKYMLRRMMSLSESGDLVPDTFQLPSACCCSYKKDLSFLSSYGIEDISARNKGKTKLPPSQ